MDHSLSHYAGADNYADLAPRRCALTLAFLRGTIAKALCESLGSVRLTELTAGDVQGALTAMGARLSSRTAQIAHNVLVRAIRHAERDDLVGRNVAALVKPPKGQLGGRPSKSLTLEQAVSLMNAARGTRLEAYVVLSLLSGLRTEEARALRWDHVVAWVCGQWQPVAEAGFDHEQVAVFVWRADRAGGDTKTPKSRRTLALALRCVGALRERQVRQAEDRLAAGPLDLQSHHRPAGRSCGRARAAGRPAGATASSTY